MECVSRGSNAVIRRFCANFNAAILNRIFQANSIGTHGRRYAATWICRRGAHQPGITRNITR